eukprot:171111-Pleurochrysis_carterae.AAC.4
MQLPSSTDASSSKFRADRLVQPARILAAEDLRRVNNELFQRGLQLGALRRCVCAVRRAGCQRRLTQRRVQAGLARRGRLIGRSVGRGALQPPAARARQQREKSRLDFLVQACALREHVLRV